MTFLKKMLIALLLFTSSMTVFAQGERGKELYQRCIQCHGADGMGNQTEGAPRIAGQHDWYLLSSLIAFKSKERINAKMDPFINDLSEADFQALAAFIGQMPGVNNNSNKEK